MREIKLGDRAIGPGNNCFIIAEAGVNHNGDVETAKKLVDVAVATKADAVKFQTFRVDLLTSENAPKAPYQQVSTNPEETQANMLRKLELSYGDFRDIQRYCQSKGIMFISTPFDHPSADLLNDMDVPIFKIPSGETVNLPLLRHIARMGKPIILSTGMSYMGEVENAVHCIYESGNLDLALLHCVSEYPANSCDVNLKAMRTMEAAFQVPIGFSDHTLGIEVPIAAVALGACIIEKHFTLDREMEGPDHRASLDPGQLGELVKAIRSVEQAIGNGVKAPVASEMNNRQVVRRSIYTSCFKNPGEIIDESDLVTLRPAGGIPPDKFDLVIGKKVLRPIPEGSLLSWEDIS